MNISTYEARIAALEAQLGPVTGEGLLSVAITPAIGNSETVLSNNLPFYYSESDGDSNIKRVYITISEAISSAFSISITPTSDYYAGFIHGQGSHVLAANPGETLTVEVTEDYDAYLYLLGLSDPSNPSAPFVQIEVYFNLL